MTLVSLLGALACHTGGASIALDSAGGGVDTPLDSGAATDTATDTATEPPSDPPPFEEATAAQDGDDLDGWIFDDATIHTVDIDIDGAAIAAVEADPDTPVRASMRFDGIRVPDIGVKLRGKIGSFRRFSGKPKLELDVNTFAPGRTFYGLKELLLNNEVVDCGYLKEPLAYATFRALGLPALRTSWATVRVNGAEYGLYVLLESPDDRFLARTFPDAGGNLYDGKYIYDRATGAYTLLDFASGQDRLFQLEEGTDVDWADIREVSTRMGLTRGTPSFYEQVGELVDMPAFHAHLAAEQLVGHNDGYALNQNNYRFYFDPGREGRMVFVAWDFDYGYLEDAWWGMSWMNPRAALASQCWNDATCRAAQRDAVDAATRTLDTAALLAKLDAWDALTRDLAAADPRRECGAWDIAPSRDYLRSWLAARPAAMRAVWGLP
jgi:spore coat protein H